MILITGANGHLGGATIDFILKQNPRVKIAGMVRSKEKGAGLEAKGVVPTIGNYTDYASLPTALKGVDLLLLISSSSMVDRVTHHANVINAAKEAGVKHIFYTSLVKADKLLSPLSADHNETEKLLKSSGITYTIFRNTFYAEYLPLFLGNALESGAWYFPSNGAKINLALRTEMAEALANALLNPNMHQNKIYEITSANAFSLSEIAAILSRAVGKEISYTDVPVEAFKEQLMQAGLPDETVMMSVGVAETFSNGALNYTDNALEYLLDRQPLDAKAFIHQFINSKN